MSSTFPRTSLTPASRAGRVKGGAIREFFTWYLGVHGRARVDELLSVLSEEDRELFDPDRAGLGILQSDWLPMRTVHQLLDEATRNLDADAYERLVVSGAHATVKALMTGAQKVVFTTLLSPRSYQKVGGLAFRLNYETGNVMNEELGPKRHRGHVEGWLSHHPFLCRMNVRIKAELYQAMGCKNVRIEERFCVSDGDAQCGSVIAWD
ncbi:MAG TPA: hypothetical protein VHE30_04790 [Polyangiaceae bacterium]|nr:hypothetical protein [Polyangiaceae bacterium]